VRFDLHLSPQTPGPDDDERVIDEVFGQLEYAKSLGFTGTWITDHQFTDRVFSDPTTTAAAISQRVPGLRIGFAVAVVPLMHPVRFVTQCNLIDQLTKGNLIVGIGPGNSPGEYASYGLDRELRHEIMQEFVEVCDLAWEPPDKDGFEFHGKHFDVEVRGRIIPAPIQRPRPHMAVATHTPARIKEAGRRGWSLLLGLQNKEAVADDLRHYLEGMDEVALSEEARARAWEHTSIVRQLYVAEDGENWLKELDDVVNSNVRESLRAAGIDDPPPADIEKRRAEYLKGVLHAGTADEVFERLRPFAELGVNNLMCWFNFGHMKDERIRASMARFHERVMPRLQEISPREGFLRSLIEKNKSMATAASVQ
jgi:alkanesulfonate monooxygenase SsuD/methylene tetrahydromethanopterin reductase-like flavin-dependent oxidoreductase (luciferase family)